MAILFKKTAVILFLLSHHVFAAAASSSGNEEQAIGSKRKSGTTSSYGLRQKKKAGTVQELSPLGVAEQRSSGGSSSATLSSSAATCTSVLSAENLSDLDSFDLFGFSLGEIVDEVEQPLSEAVLIDTIIEAVRQEDLAQIQSLFIQHPQIFVKINELSDSLGGFSPFMHAIISRNRPLVEFFISTGQVDPNSISKSDKDVIFLILEQFSGDIELVKQLLVSSRVEISSKNALTILNHLRILASPLFEPLVKALISVRHRSIKKALLLLAKDAVCQDDTQTLHLLASNGVSINLKYFCGSYLIHFATTRGNVEMIAILLHYGASIDAISEPLNISALQIAYYDGNYDLARALIRVSGARAGLEDVIKRSIDDGSFPLFFDLLLSLGDLSNFILPGGYNLITYCLSIDCPALLSLVLNPTIFPSGYSVIDQQGRSILTMEIPEKCAETLAATICRIRNPEITQDA